MLDLPEEIILFDTEYTSWEGSYERGWSEPNEFRELVQIGAVKINSDTFEELDSFVRYMFPVKNPTLSYHFTHLTGISQEILDKNGISFEEALLDFKMWYGNTHLYSFGGDERHFHENIGFQKLDIKIEDSQFHNVIEVFEKHDIPARDYMSSTITEAFGITSSHKGHDAVGDARSIALALKLLYEKNKRRSS